MLNVIGILLRTLWIYTEQVIRGTVVRHGKEFDVSYVLHGRLYTIRVRPVRGPHSMTPEERGVKSLVNKEWEHLESKSSSE
jgi:hypothetical protein